MQLPFPRLVPAETSPAEPWYWSAWGALAVLQINASLNIFSPTNCSDCSNPSSCWRFVFSTLRLSVWENSSWYQKFLISTFFALFVSLLDGPLSCSQNAKSGRILKLLNESPKMCKKKRKENARRAQANCSCQRPLRSNSTCHAKSEFRLCKRFSNLRTKTKVELVFVMNLILS